MGGTYFIRIGRIAYACRGTMDLTQAWQGTALLERDWLVFLLAKAKVSRRSLGLIESNIIKLVLFPVFERVNSVLWNSVQSREDRSV